MSPQEGWIPENPLFSLDLCVNFLLQTTEFVVQSQELMFFEGMRGVLMLKVSLVALCPCSEARGVQGSLSLVLESGGIHAGQLSLCRL